MFTLIMILAITVSVISFAGMNILTHFHSLINVLTAFILGLSVFLIFKPDKEQKLNLKLDNTVENNLLQEDFQKALQDYEYISTILKQLKDIELKQQIQIMQKTAKNILVYLQKHPEKISLARRFINYYQDTTVTLLEKYIELEATQLSTDNVQEIKNRTKNTILSLNNAYTKQFEKILNDQLIDMDAELKVMEQSIKADGISLNNNKTQSLNYENCNFPRKNRRKFHNMKIKEHIYNIPEYLMESNSNILQRKLTASCLGILFGGFGAHKFYLKKTAWGVVYLIFSWTGIPFIVGFIEGIRYLFMSKEEFYNKYIIK